MEPTVPPLQAGSCSRAGRPPLSLLPGVFPVRRRVLPSTPMTQANLTCYIRQDNKTPRLVLDGAIDIATAPQALAALQRFIQDRGPDVVVDASRVNFIDSRGVGTLIQVAKEARDAGGQLYLHNPALPVTKILEMCQL